MKNSVFSQDLVDAFLETANLGVGRAAASLHELTGRKVEIHVPELCIFWTDEPIKMLDLQQTAVLRVSQRFSSDLEGYALLILNEVGATRVAKLILGEEIETESFGETEQSALLELANIMLNGVMGSLANQMKLKLVYQVPFLDLKGIADVVDLVRDLLPENPGRVVFMRAAIKISAETVHGYVVMVLDEESFQLVISRLEDSL